MTKDLLANIFFSMKQETQDIVVITIVAAVLFWAMPSIIEYLNRHEPESDAKRGCVASAYQATKNGEDLEANLKVCNEL